MNLPALFNEAYTDAATALGTKFNLPKKEQIYVLYNQRIGQAWGNAKVWNSHPYTRMIKLSKDLCQNTNENSILNTMIHEIIHCCGIWNHRKNFKLAAAIINRMFPGKYNVSRCSSVDSKMDEEQMDKAYKYIIACPKCGMKWGFKRYTKCVYNVDLCWCSKCRKETGEKITLKRIK